MNKQDKIFEVQNLAAMIKDAKAIALTDFKGTNMSQLNLLREKVKEAGGTLQVVKNNLFFRALSGNNYKIEKSQLDGQNLVIFANEDEVNPLKALVGVGKTTNLFSIKLGFMAGNILTAEDIAKFASLPSKLQLQAKLVGLLASPPTRLVYALNWNIQRLVMLLNEVKNKKAQN